MKHILTILLTLCASVVLAQQVRYVDATSLTIIGQALATDKPYNRIDIAKYDIPKECHGMCGYSTGVAVVFSTNSTKIDAKWTTTKRMPSINMSAITQKGLDLYIYRDGRWVWAGCGRPASGAKDIHSGNIISKMTDEEKLCLIYLPIFDEVKQLEIGVEEDATIKAVENPFRHKVVVHGSSITHGASSSRAGMTYPALLARRTGLDMVNLGFSGQATLQPEFAEFLAQVEDADAFLFDTFSNPRPEMIEERFDKFVDIIREKHPTTPLIFTQTIRRDTRNFNTSTEEWEARKQAAAERVVRERMKRDKHIYFLDSEGWLGDDNVALSDGTHPTDLGFMRMVEKMEPRLKKILRKYDIK